MKLDTGLVNKILKLETLKKEDEDDKNKQMVWKAY